MSDLKYNLEDRTARFAENIILLCRKVQKDSISIPLVNQLIRSGTSIGANYFEANGASSKKDFKNKISICRKEARETKYWLQLLGKSSDGLIQLCRELWKEANELTLIFSKIVINTKDR